MNKLLKQSRTETDLSSLPSGLLGVFVYALVSQENRLRTKDKPETKTPGTLLLRGGFQAPRTWFFCCWVYWPEQAKPSMNPVCSFREGLPEAEGPPRLGEAGTGWQRRLLFPALAFLWQLCQALVPR